MDILTPLDPLNSQRFCPTKRNGDFAEPPFCFVGPIPRSELPPLCTEASWDITLQHCGGPRVDTLWENPVCRMRQTVGISPPTTKTRQRGVIRMPNPHGIVGTNLTDIPMPFDPLNS
uniref:Uncharacterized protein n=1 Tax=Nelumbo nucifera TaxID=4432 RepID=A0A822ZFW4_NELNU|nr:TPA_asm: hypothetical protein HUJ06_001703 [Nelumbo nucifera]